MKKTLYFLEENLEELLMVILVAGMAIIMGIQVFSRYFLQLSLSWSEEITRYLFIWSAFLSVSLCTKKCISIKIDQFIKAFSKRMEAAFKLANITISIAFFAYLIPYAYKYLEATIQSGQVSPACGIPMYYIQSAPLICFILTTIHLAQRWIINLKIVCNKDVSFPEEGNLAQEIVESVDSTRKEA